MYVQNIKVYKIWQNHKFEYLEPEMENWRHKKNTCQKKKNPPKMASENAFK